MLLQEMLPILSKQNKTVGEMLFSVRPSSRAKEAGGCLTKVIDAFWGARNLNRVSVSRSY